MALGRPPDGPKNAKAPKRLTCGLSKNADFSAGHFSAKCASAQVYVVAIICQELQPLQ
jgi:hypothetical protein